MPAKGLFHHRYSTGLRRELGALTFRGEIASLAFRTALASVLSMVVALMLHLETPVWAGITALAIVQPNVSATFARCIDRCLGTIAGATVGYIGARFVAEHLVFQLICAGATVFGIYSVERSKHGYAALLGAVTVILVMFGSMETPQAALSIAVYRALEIMVGVAVSYVIEVFLAPPEAAAPAKRRPGIFALPIDRGLLVTAITGGIATASIPAIWEGLQLPGLGQTPVTAFVIMVMMRKEPWWAALNRVAGCLLGGAFGLLCMHFIDDDIVSWLMLMFAGLYVTCHVKHGGGDAAYSGHQAAVAVAMSMLPGLGPSADIMPAINRLVGIIGGVIVVVVAQALVAPLVARLLPHVLDRLSQRKDAA